MQGLSDLMQEMGMTDGSGSGSGSGQGNQQGKGDPKDCPYKGKRDSGSGDLNSNGKDEGGTHKDHRTDSRDDADKNVSLDKFVQEVALDVVLVELQMQRDLWIRQTK